MYRSTRVSIAECVDRRYSHMSHATARVKCARDSRGEDARRDALSPSSSWCWFKTQVSSEWICNRVSRVCLMADIFYLLALSACVSELNSVHIIEGRRRLGFLVTHSRWFREILKMRVANFFVHPNGPQTNANSANVWKLHISFVGASVNIFFRPDNRWWRTRKCV